MTASVKILIVDDNEQNRNVLNDFVIALGHAPVTAENGAAALAMLREDAPDLVLLDILMPGISGYDVLEQMRQAADFQHIPVIMISAVDEISSVVQCIEKGADDYLVKPFNPVLLRARLEACIEKKRLRDREQELHNELSANYEALKRAEGARDALADMIVHDLNSPLTGILGFTDLMLHGLDGGPVDKEQLRKDLLRVRDSGVQMSSLIACLLDVSRLEAGQMPISKANLDATCLARDVCDQFRTQAERAGVSLSFASETGETTVCADKLLLSRVLQNLLSNAIKHTDKGASVCFAVKGNQGSVLFSIEDNGPGIPAQYKDKIFDKFFQAEARREKRKFGVGLGLTFCKMATEAQGGRIWVDSEEGKGAAFHVELAAGNA